MAMHPLAIAAAFATLALVAGSAFAFTKVAKAHVPPLSLTALRLVIGAAALGVTSPVLHRLGRRRHEALDVLAADERKLPLSGLALARTATAMALLNNVIPYTLYPIAMNLGINIGVVAVLAATSPLIAAALVALARRPPTLGRALWPALALGLAGVALLYAEALAGKSGKHATARPVSDTLLGYSLVLVAAACKGAAAVVAEAVLGPRLSYVRLALAQTAAGAVVAVIAAAAVDTWHPLSLSHHYPARMAWLASMDGSAWGGVVYLGLGGSCLAYLLQFVLVRELGAVRQVGVDFAVPVVAAIEGALFFHEWAGQGVALLWPAAGMATILAALALMHATHRTPPPDSAPSERAPLIQGA
ncbi:uncharacterized protein AMSG_03003 [Thecamonas trahens ATCC 50062]|uniref:EamA domain-containing protein n=1 Tax=Thecamonas trahens ATCC 50062 TaxID=461836 RepID=A0A0L0D5J6_THETB|nr:hypothetical protein AMSG_03003 [Thecamonas trahens ATCC 50062]KNC46568.1 hypothetical protein AMSG_03003 [Thecamonas trahens ATCC 50062]|eukprot:XP_013760345.1 hypothetical protein AMSG_03003 [Thecamonas trahens ATCC 50062]